MNITPLTRQRPRPIALVTPGIRSMLVTTAGSQHVFRGQAKVLEGLQRLHKHACYVDGRLLNLRHTTGAEHWQASTWRGRATSMTLDGCDTKVYTLRGAVTGTERCFTALSTFVSWCESKGVAAGSLSQMGWNLWRSTLEHPVRLASDPDVGRAALYGGRQEAAEPRSYRHMVAWDMRSAYVHAMAHLGPYATTLREVAPSTLLDPEMPGVAEAVVTVPPELEYPPLPHRLCDSVIQWQWGVIEGTWPWRELAMAERLGCTVQVRRSFAPMATADPFVAWERLCQEARTLPDSADVLTKLVANSLWGTFGMTSSQRGTVRWMDDLGEHPIKVDAPERRIPQATTAHIAAETSSRVRVRLVEEGLYGSTGRIVHVDTDGIILGRNRRHPTEGSEPGQWRVKHVMRMLEVRAPQVYRFKDACQRCWSATHWHYVAAGVAPDLAAELFTRGITTNVAIFGTDMVLPPDHASHHRTQARLLQEAMVAEDVLMGPRLP